MFDRLSALPADPLLGLITAFRDDTNPNKVDLGVGVYRDESGHTPIMSAVQKPPKSIWLKKIVKPISARVAFQASYLK